MLRVIRCNAGECKQNEENTDYIQIVHVKNYPKQIYERYLVVWSSKGPKYEVKEIGGPLALPGMEQLSAQFVTSMNFVPDAEVGGKCGERMDVGYLDTPIILSIDAKQRGTFAFLLTPEQVLAGAERC